ncbi:MAG: hypothetical protein KatS3mg129_2069 [Leptospiraceae bacterium]|nr:MAG: hypothetical protein KatS3mg129_2069 [Leptospiraceae bacterium]
MDLFRYIIIFIGILIAGLGIFHQLIVGGIVTRLIEAEEKDLRLYLMSWITHGAYVTLCGILPVVLLIFYPSYDASVLTTLFILAIAMTILVIHIGITGLKYKIIPITLEFISLTIYSILIFIYYFLNK